MRQPDDFDAFYKDARERLLAQTYALTGDLGASRRAVRDAFMVAWHRWRKLSRLEPGQAEDVVRPHAWRLAQRNHTARVWHREKDLTPEVHEILDALGKLSVPQRKTLVLTQLASVTMPQMAREVGVPLEQAERDLQSGAAALALGLDIETAELRRVFETLAASVGGRGRWPRASIVRRSGAARRRTHTVVGVVGAVAAVAVTGALVTEPDGVRPTLQESASRLVVPQQGPGDGADQVPVRLPQSALLVTGDVESAYANRSWTLLRTADNSSGNGIAVPCQRDRYADPRGEATLVRYFRSTPPGAAPATPSTTDTATTSPTGSPTDTPTTDDLSDTPTTAAPPSGPVTTVTQLTEESSNPKAAGRTFRTTAGWAGGCTDERVQLLGTRTPQGVGDEAVQLVLRRWSAPVSTMVVGVARTGRYTTTTAVVVPGSDVPDREAAAELLASSVQGLCTLPDAGRCAPDKPRLVDRTPLPAGPRPAMISEFDLPPVDGVDRPWVGTDPSRPTTNAAATGCDGTSFSAAFQGRQPTRGGTRTFVVPGARLPQEFGLTETVAALPPARAEAFVAQVRDKLGSCPERDLNTEVDELAREDAAGGSLTAWRLDVKVTDARTVVFYMAIIRRGTALAQVGFVPAGDATMSSESFVALAERSRDRLAELPAPG